MNIIIKSGVRYLLWSGVYKEVTILTELDARGEVHN